MSLRDILVPQMGEGLREVLIHKLLKKPGEFVRRDEVIYVMESDKAVIEVESPYEGTLREWLVEEASVLAVGAAVARIDTASVATADDSFRRASEPSAGTAGRGDGVATPDSTRPPASPPARAAVFVPPRTRAYCKALAISEDEIARIPASGGTLMPADIDSYLTQKLGTSVGREPHPLIEGEAAVGFRDYRLPAHQRVLAFRLAHSARFVVPGTMKRQLPWQQLKQAVKVLRRANPGLPASDFETFAYAVVRASQEHAQFRSVLLKDDVVREFEHLDLGLAVQRPTGELMTAVVPQANLLGFPSFVALTQERVRQALAGEDQVNERVALHIDYAARLKITDGIPVLIAPAVAVVFLCAPTGPPQDRMANLGVTFDHRLINGGGAARLLNSIVEQVQRLAADGDETEEKS